MAAVRGLCPYAHELPAAVLLHQNSLGLCIPPLSFTPLPTDKVILRRQPWTVPASYAFGDSEVVPMWAGQECPWTVVEQ